MGTFLSLLSLPVISLVLAFVWSFSYSVDGLIISVNSNHLRIRYVGREARLYLHEW